MLQQLLADRFKLAVHREMKDSPGYALVLAKDGSKLRASKGASSQTMILKNGLRANNASVAFLAAALSNPTGRKVVDQTGLQDNLDIALDYAPAGDTDSSLPSVFTALQEQLGLKLVPLKVPVETLVIDYGEKIPTEN